MRNSLWASFEQATRARLIQQINWWSIERDVAEILIFFVSFVYFVDQRDLLDLLHAASFYEINEANYFYEINEANEKTRCTLYPSLISRKDLNSTISFNLKN